MEKAISVILCLAMLISSCAGAYAYDNTTARAVIGADLSDAQIQDIYKSFGFARGTVPEIRINNALEHSYLDGYVASSVIGTKSVSCVYIELLPAGSGMDIVTYNVTEFTPEMYASAFATAGITDARIIVSAPFEVSGTCALAGVYLAYEQLAGARLNEQSRDVSARELSITGGLAGVIGSDKAAGIVNELKLMFTESGFVKESDITSIVTKAAAEYGVELTKAQISELVKLYQSFEKLDAESFSQRIHQAQETINRLSETAKKVKSFLDIVIEIIREIADFFRSILRDFGIEI